MSLSDPVLHEVFELWGAWETVVGHLAPRGADARTIDPLQVNELLRSLSVEETWRLCHLFVGHRHADTTDEASDLLAELRGYAGAGRRPRFGAEAMTLERFSSFREDHPA